MLEISHSSTSIARGCWQKYYWHYIEGLKPKRTSNAMQLGSVIHEAFEGFYAGLDDSTVMDGIRAKYDNLIGETQDMGEQELLALDSYTAQGMWGSYPHKDRSVFDSIECEKEFSITLPNLRKVRFVGRVDGLVKIDGLWWVREMKTTGLSPRQFIGRCNTSMQASGYVYAMRKMGYPVQGVIYDVIKRPLLRKRQNERVEDFGKRIVIDYQEDAKKPQQERKAYVQHTEYRPQYMIDQWVDSQVKLTSEIRYRRRKNDWFRNADQCWNFNSLCPYSKLCHVERADQLTKDAFFTKEVR